MRGKNKKDIFVQLGNGISWLILVLFFVAMPLYFCDGYQKIATRKYNLMIYGSVGIIALTVLFLIAVLLLRGISSKDVRKYNSIILLDVFALSYAVISIFSYFFSIYKKYGEKNENWFVEGALYGTEGWYMGLATILIMVFMYFVISRNLLYSQRIWIPIITVSTIIFLWAILNRFEIYPIEMKYQTEKFLSSIGNINWLAGYSSIVMPVIVGLYWKNKVAKYEKILIFPLIVTLSNVLLNGSDSLVVSFLITMVVLLQFSYKDKMKMLKFSEICMWFTFNGFMIFLTDEFYDITRTDYSEIGKIFDGGIWSLFWFLTGLTMYLYMYFCVKDKLKYPNWCSLYLGKIVACAVIFLFVAFLIVLIINTMLGNTIPGIRNIAIFYFDYEWGTKRGAIYEEAYWVFRESYWWQKIIGVGPDTFYFQLINTQRAMRINDYIFGTARLTNAHSEFFTILVNEGILGVCSFAGIIVTSLRFFGKKAEGYEGLVVYVLVIVMYVTNNLISFQTILNTPLLFVMLGIGASQFLKESKEK